jgi:seryl-tRNA synthetase
VAEAIAALSRPDGLSARKSLEQSFKDKQMVDKFIAKASNYPTISTALQAKDQASQGYNKAVADYMKVAGEVFARQTEQRRGMSATERAANPAMRAIETDPQNIMAGVTIDNMTAPRAGTTEQAAYIVPEWELKERSIQEKKEFPDGSRKLNNPIKLQDGSRLSGFTGNSQEVFYGYDKNGEIFTIRKEFVKPEDIVSSRDSNKTADKIRSRLLELQKPTDFADPFAMQVPQSTIPEGM